MTHDQRMGMDCVCRSVTVGPVGFGEASVRSDAVETMRNDAEAKSLSP